MTTKDKSIVRLLSALDLRRRGWSVLDHWEGDTCAVGISRKTEPRRLVYVSTFSKKPDRYDYECEAPSGPRDVDYHTSDRGEDVTYDQLLQALLRHLS